VVRMEMGRISTLYHREKSFLGLPRASKCARPDEKIMRLCSCSPLYSIVMAKLNATARDQRRLVPRRKPLGNPLSII
jgi:hypothetical protein